MLRDTIRNSERSNCCTESYPSLFLELKAKTEITGVQGHLEHSSFSLVQVSVQSYPRRRIVYCSMSTALLPFSKHVESISTHSPGN